jgi:hypothetical protein
MDKNFAEMAKEYEAEIDDSNDETAESRLSEGDECPEDYCERTLHSLSHSRDSQLGTDPHPDAPETEIVCLADGVVESR